MSAYQVEMQVGGRTAQVITESNSGIAHAAKLAIAEVMTALGEEPRQLTVKITRLPFSSLSWVEPAGEAAQPGE